MSRTRICLAALCIAGCASFLFAMQQWGGGRGGRRGGRGSYDGGRNGVPTWDYGKGFKKDVFTFARVQYSDYGGWGGEWGKWRVDYPDSDLNFSLRLQQLTSLKVNPDPVTVRLTDPTLFDYPFLYMIEPGNLQFSEEEVAGLRKYLDNGGFMMVDDFWGDYEYNNFYQQIKRVFPERDAEEVPLEHEIFQCVYPMKEKPQVLDIGAFRYGRPRGGRDVETPHYKAFFDDERRIMVFICHNTDLGDGWEREGENKEYFAEYAVKKSYPLGINIVTYAMTH